MRAVQTGQPGIKALILYPMNALASDQAGRIARTIHDDSRLAGIRAGIFVGGESSGTSVMIESRIIDDQHTLRASPPDILLTNYKMLDFLLLRDTDHELWAETGPGVLRYVVLDEFHTYDGAQGTDVAMLLRRLGVTLYLADSSHGPLGSVAPVATSATLGDSAGGADALRDFAESVFGRPFQTDSVIGERRESVNDCCKPVDWDLPIPEIDDLRMLDGTDTNDIASRFIGRPPADTIDLGDALLAHRMTRAVLGAVGGRPTPVADALDEIVLRVSEWGPHLGRDRPAVEHAVALYFGLLSAARRPGPPGGDPVPLFSVEVQLWIREVSRVTRLVQAAPRVPVARWRRTRTGGASRYRAAPHGSRDLLPTVRQDRLDGEIVGDERRLCRSSRQASTKTASAAARGFARWSAPPPKRRACSTSTPIVSRYTSSPSRRVYPCS